MHACLSIISVPPPPPPSAARPAALPPHLPGLQGAEQRAAALREPLQPAGPAQHGAGQRGGGGGPHPAGARPAGDRIDRAHGDRAEPEICCEDSMPLNASDQANLCFI